MADATPYVPIALSFLLLIVCVICHRSKVDRTEVEEKSLRLLRSWLSPKQAQQWDTLSEFEVVGSHTETRYRIRRGKVMNIHELANPLPSSPIGVLHRGRPRAGCIEWVGSAQCKLQVDTLTGLSNGGVRVHSSQHRSAGWLPPRVPRRHRHPPMLDLFDADTFGPQPDDRQPSGFRRHLEWISRHVRWLATFAWPARMVIVLGEIAVAYLCLLFGLLVGAALHG
jgi:hypothetical protein